MAVSVAAAAVLRVCTQLEVLILNTLSLTEVKCSITLFILVLSAAPCLPLPVTDPHPLLHDESASVSCCCCWLLLSAALCSLCFLHQSILCVSIDNCIACQAQHDHTNALHQFSTITCSAFHPSSSIACSQSTAMHAYAHLLQSQSACVATFHLLANRMQLLGSFASCNQFSNSLFHKRVRM